MDRFYVLIIKGNHREVETVLRERGLSEYVYAPYATVMYGEMRVFLKNATPLNNTITMRSYESFLHGEALGFKVGSLLLWKEVSREQILAG